MKIIEGMKKIKDLNQKFQDLTEKIGMYSAHMDYERPYYGDEHAQKIKDWVQSCGDMIKEISRLRTAIQRTNIQTKVTIEIGGNSIEKTIAEWIHRRRDLATMEQSIWAKLTDRNLKDGSIKQTDGAIMKTQVVRYYDPLMRDLKIEMFRSEPNLIDGKMEVVNATTDLIE